MNIENKWVITKKSKVIGEGGSGRVKECHSYDDSTKYAIKQLRDEAKQKKGRKERFEIEIKTNLSFAGKENFYKTMPMIDYDKDEYGWYVSKIGIPSIKYIKNKKLEPLKIIFLYKEFLKGIKEIHKAKIFHRDIKPDNILFYKDSFRIIDFGIVSNDELNLSYDLTQKYDNNELGARFTMAPEMRRNPASANPLKADIYSLAKTLWILITHDKKCFDGQYNTNNHSLYGYFENFGKVFNLSILDDILRRCTNDFPEERCNIDEFIDALEHIVWSNSCTNKGLGKELYLSRTHSLETLNKYIPCFPHFNLMDLNINSIDIICNLINNKAFTFTQSSFKNIKDIDSMKIINNEYFIFGNDTEFTKYLNIKDIENIFLLNESGIPFTVFIKMIDEYIILICDNETSNDFIFNNKNLYIPKIYLKNLVSLKKYLYKKTLS